MGLNPQSEQTNRSFINIVQGCFAKRVEENSGGIKRIIKKKDGSEKTVYEIYYKDIDAMIDNVSVKEGGKFGDQLLIDMSDIDQSVTIILPMDSKEAKNFLRCLKNINLRQMVTLAPYNFDDKEIKDRKVIGMNVYQNGKTKEFKVAPYFSKESPNGLPQVPENADKDEFKLAMKSQEIFLKKWVKVFAADKFPLPSANTASVKHKEGKIEPNPATRIEEDQSRLDEAAQDKLEYDDGLPF